MRPSGFLMYMPTWNLNPWFVIIIVFNWLNWSNLSSFVQETWMNLNQWKTTILRLSCSSQQQKALFFTNKPISLPKTSRYSQKTSKAYLFVNCRGCRRLFSRAFSSPVARLPTLETSIRVCRTKRLSCCANGGISWERRQLLGTVLGPVTSLPTFETRVWGSGTTLSCCVWKGIGWHGTFGAITRPVAFLSTSKARWTGSLAKQLSAWDSTGFIILRSKWTLSML